MGSADSDDQVRWEHRKQDADYARTQSDRRSEIARGFTHTDALYALYGYVRLESGYPADYQAELRDELLHRRQRLMELRPQPQESIESRSPVVLFEADQCFQRLSEIDVTDPDADTELQQLLEQVTSATRWRFVTSTDVMPSLKDGLTRLISVHEHFKKVHASSG
jgi:hypothetical protein